MKNPLRILVLLFVFLPAVGLLARPTIWLVGDSTVRVSTPNQVGWGTVVDQYFDQEKVEIVNRAIGGRSSRTYIAESRWNGLLDDLDAGDFVLIQFGHNDNGPINDNFRARGTIRGIGDEEVVIHNKLTGEVETVYSYGHYLRKYVEDTKAAGAIPVICSPVPMKNWEGNRIRREDETYALWARQVAGETGALFIDLNEIIARGYEILGKGAVEPFFADERVHTSEAGAHFNAKAVISGMKLLEGNPFEPYFNAAGRAVEQYPPKRWIDPDTGHEVLRLSGESGTASLYFHQNAYTAEGDKMVVTVPDGIATINLKTMEIEKVVDGRAWVILVGKKTRSVYYLQGTREQLSVYRAHLDTHEVQKIGDLPPGGSISSLNADETLLLGTFTKERPEPLVEGEADAAKDGANPQGEWMRETPMVHPRTGESLTFAEQKEWRLNNRLEARIPMAMYVMHVDSGEVEVVHQATDWLNHLQFSPADPGLIMFCHEGPWHKVDRIWTIRTDGSGLRKVHERTMNMEIAGHEFFSPDGETIWYDLQTPRGEVFWLAGYNLESGKRTWYHLDRNAWSVHFNVSPDGTLFAGDGGDEEMVAHAPDGKWIYLFEPEPIPDVAGISADNAEDLIDPGVLRAKRLVNMQYHDYRLEPNVTFTPDGEWIVFRSNMHGPTHVYAVRITQD